MKRCFVLLTSLLLLLAGGYWFSHDRGSGIRHQGKSLEAWFDQLNNPNGDTNAAKAAILQMGARAVPFLAGQLSYNPSLQTNYLRWKEKLSWEWRSKLPAVPQIDWGRRQKAAWVLGEMGPEAKAAIPGLIGSMGLTEPIEVSVPNGANARSWNPRVRAESVRAIEKIDLENPDAVRAQAENLNTGMPFKATNEFSLQAARTLEKIPHPAEETVRAMLSQLEKQNQAVYFQDLERFGATFLPHRGMGMALSAINSETNAVKALASTNAVFREAAAFELGDPEREGFNRHAKPGRAPSLSDESLAALRKCLSDPEEAVRLNAAESLFKTRRGQPREIVPTLVPLLDSPDSFNQLRAIEVLRQLGSEAREALPALKEKAGDPIGFVSVWAAKAVQEIQEEK